MHSTIEIHQLINILEQFFSDDINQILDIGEMVGCNLIRYVGEAAVSVTDFKRILFVSGIQDFVYARKDTPNHIFWKVLFEDYIVDNIFYSYETPRMGDEKREYLYNVSTYFSAGFDVMIINQAQMIPPVMLEMICKSFSGKIVRIFDPFDKHGANYTFPPLLCVDTFEKLTPNLGFARWLYGVQTRSVEKRSRAILDYNAKISRRSIGKIDDKQYVTNNPDIYDIIQKKQHGVSFKKNQKIVITDDRFNNRPHTGYIHPQSLGNGTLLHIIRGGASYNTACRIHSSTVNFNIPIAYDIDPFRTPHSVIHVAPANIMDINTAALHRYKHIVYVTTDSCRELSIRDQYTLIKIAQSVTFATTK